jgi:C-terminal processing protease CtpA/Prc
LQELEKDGAIDDLVLDLRGNPGGVLEGPASSICDKYSAGPSIQFVPGVDLE